MRKSPLYSPWGALKASDSHNVPGLGPSDADVASTLHWRYGTNNDAEVLQRLKDEMGVSTPIYDSPLSSQENMGGYDTRAKEILLPRDLKNSEIAPTGLHELVHAKDDQEYGRGNMGSPNEKKNHFTHLGNDETLKNSIMEQYYIEHGFEPDPQLTNNVPGLNKIRAYSSQPLFNPWAAVKKERGL